MKEGEKQRKFHEALLKMLYPPPPNDDEEEEEKSEAEPVLIESLNDPPGVCQKFSTKKRKYIQVCY